MVQKRALQISNLYLNTLNINIELMFYEMHVTRLRNVRYAIPLLKKYCMYTVM